MGYRYILLKVAHRYRHAMAREAQKSRFFIFMYAQHAFLLSLRILPGIRGFILWLFVFMYAQHALFNLYFYSIHNLQVYFVYGCSFVRLFRCPGPSGTDI